MNKNLSMSLSISLVSILMGSSLYSQRVTKTIINNTNTIIVVAIKGSFDKRPKTTRIKPGRKKDILYSQTTLEKLTITVPLKSSYTLIEKDLAFGIESKLTDNKTIEVTDTCLIFKNPTSSKRSQSAPPRTNNSQHTSTTHT